VGCDDSTVRQTDVGKEAFIALNKNPTDQSIRKTHLQVIAEVSIDAYKVGSRNVPNRTTFGSYHEFEPHAAGFLAQLTSLC
jgi:hypothetical protein